MHPASEFLFALRFEEHRRRRRQIRAKGGLATGYRAEMQCEPRDVQLPCHSQCEAAVKGVEIANDYGWLNFNIELAEPSRQECRVAQSVLISQFGNNPVTHDHIVNGRDVHTLQSLKQIQIGRWHPHSQVIAKKINLARDQIPIPRATVIGGVHEM
jgi:hypothetical protein